MQKEKEKKKGKEKEKEKEKENEKKGKEKTGEVSSAIHSGLLSNSRTNVGTYHCRNSDADILYAMPIVAGHKLCCTFGAIVSASGTVLDRFRHSHQNNA
jgi:hypothetical protein